jgi:acetylornithine deacetylase/succinyl-diaminopimelate desuccinylase-like protein
MDMKGAVAMMLAAVMKAKADGLVPAGDIILAILADEEAGGDFGARFLVQDHPEWFANVHYALGEAGGFTFHLGKRRFYPIQVAEKQICWMTATIQGPGGQGSMIVQGSAMSELWPTELDPQPSWYERDRRSTAVKRFAS